MGKNKPKINKGYVSEQIVEKNIPNIEKFISNHTVDAEDVPQVAVESKSTKELLAQIKKADHDAINKVLLEILSPELKQNETQKRKFKQQLMKYIKRILTWQLVFVVVPMLFAFYVSCFKASLESETALKFAIELYSFLKFYISAIIVEFIAMLFFIVKYVFDKSIVDLMAGLLHSKKDENDEKDEEK